MEPVLSNIGISGPIKFDAYDQAVATARQQKFLDQRERFQAEQRDMQRKQMGAEFLDKQLDDKNFLSGTYADQSVLSDLGDIRNKAYQRLLNGDRLQDVEAEMQPAISQLEQKRAKAKFINGELDAQVKRLSKDGGYDTDALTKAAKIAAFYNKDPKTGQYTLKDVNDIDPTKDYVNQVVNEDPTLTNFNGVQAYAKAAPHSTYDQTATSITGPGKTNTKQLSVTAPAYMVLNRNDETGQPDLDSPKAVPNYEVIRDDDGKPIGRALDVGVANDLTKKFPSALAAARHETERYFNEHGQKDISWNDPKVDMHMRSVLYQELAGQNNSIVRTKDIDKESAGATKLDNAQKEIQFAANKAAAEEKARQDVKQQYKDTGDTDVPKKGRTMDEFGKILSGQTDISEGDVKTIGGAKAVNILPFLPGGKMKSGSGERSDYEGVYFDKSSGRLFTQKKDENPKEIDNPVHFITQIAEANGWPITRVKDLVTKYGLKGNMKAAPKPAWQLAGKAVHDSKMDEMDPYILKVKPNE